MIVKEHRYSEGLLVAACDSNLIGKKFEEDNLQLDLSSDFYKGRELKENELKRVLKKARVANLVGEKTVLVAISLGLVDKEKVIKIKNVPHCQFFVDR